MLTDILSEIICSEFMRHGKGQFDKDFPGCMDIRFGTKVDYDSEEGYRYAHLRLFAPENYVRVLCKTSSIIALLNPDCEDSSLTYLEEESDWSLLCDHDSGWRSAVSSWLSTNGDNLTTLQSGLSSWYVWTDLSSDEISSIMSVRRPVLVVDS